MRFGVRRVEGAVFLRERFSIAVEDEFFKGIIEYEVEITVKENFHPFLTHHSAFGGSGDAF